MNDIIESYQTRSGRVQAMLDYKAGIKEPDDVYLPGSDQYKGYMAEFKDMREGMTK